ncbi:MAG: creatininase family protein, partial [Promethearchaeota archaeon]
IVPVGSTEQHGPHLSLKLDIFLATEIAKEAAKRAMKDVKPIVAPPIAYGISESPGFSEYPQVSLTPATFLSVCKDVAKSLIRQGFKKILFLNGHGGNSGMLDQAINEVTSETGALCIIAHWWYLIAKEINQIVETEGGVWGHAAEIETSLAWALGMKIRPVGEEAKWIPRIQPEFQDYLLPLFAPKIPVTIPWLSYPKIALKFWPGPDEAPGTLGDPSKASKEKGEKLLEPLYEKLVELLRRLKTIKVTLK